MPGEVDPNATLLSEADVKAAGEAGAADKAAADKAAADKAAADTKTAADAKAAQEAADAKLTPEQRAAKKTADDDKAAADKAEADKKAQAAKAPEKYEAFKVPEGVKLDEALSTELQTVAKELNLTQEQAQKLADLGVKQAQSFQSHLAGELGKAAKEWNAMSRADKELGGGEGFDKNLAAAKAWMAEFASPELGKLLKDSGLGSHPEVVRMFYRVGKALADDKFVPGQRAAGETRSIADRLYGNKAA